MHKHNVIAFAADSRQLPAALFAARRAAQLNPRQDTRILIFTDAADDAAATQAFAPWCELMVIEFNRDRHALHMPAFNSRISGASLFRFFLPGLTGDDTERVIYLDTDTCVDDPVFFRLFDLDMKGHTVAAVRDLETAYGATDYANGDLAKAGLAVQRKYLNAGVMLIDRRRYVEAALERKFFDASMRRRIHDQAAINRVLAGEWLELSPAFNMTTKVRNSFVAEVCKSVVTHFLGKYKPWHGPAFAYGHPVYAEMVRFFANSPWTTFLARHVAEADEALRAIQTKKPRLAGDLRRTLLAAQWPFLPRPTDYHAVVAYLRQTPFADVEQGLTRLDLARIPPKLAA